MQSQLDYFRDLVQNELIPRVVKLVDGFYICDWCGCRTDASKCPGPKEAKHVTYCKLHKASIVWE